MNFIKKLTESNKLEIYQYIENINDPIKIQNMDNDITKQIFYIN